MRHEYLKSVLRQDIGYFDTTATSGERRRVPAGRLAGLGPQICELGCAHAENRLLRAACGLCPAARQLLLSACLPLLPPPLPAWLFPGAGRLLQGLNEDCQSIQLAVGDKVGNVIFNLTTALVGIVLGERPGGSGPTQRQRPPASVQEPSFVPPAKAACRCWRGSPPPSPCKFSGGLQHQTLLSSTLDPRRRPCEGNCMQWRRQGAQRLILRPLPLPPCN
jgi:hypothetical protein